MQVYADVQLLLTVLLFCLDISEEKAKSIGIYKCYLCEINGKTEVLYEEGIYKCFRNQN